MAQFAGVLATHHFDLNIFVPEEGESRQMCRSNESARPMETSAASYGLIEDRQTDRGTRGIATTMSLVRMDVRQQAAEILVRMSTAVSGEIELIAEVRGDAACVESTLLAFLQTTRSARTTSTTSTRIEHVHRGTGR
jgi:hypothetical protein